jgi:DNA repair protein RecO (recombination protein O)
VEKSRAILIRRHKLSETSLICTWLTRDHGKIRTAARGALRPGTPFHGKLDLFYEADIAFTFARRGDLHTLREAVLIAPFDGQGLHYSNLAVAAYFAELTDRATETGGPCDAVFDLLHRAVNHLRHTHPVHRAITFFESELCRALGILDVSGRNAPLEALESYCGRIPASRERAIRSLDPSLPLAASDRADTIKP